MEARRQVAFFATPGQNMVEGDGRKEGGRREETKTASVSLVAVQDRSRLVRWVVLLERRQASAEFSTATLTNSRGIHSIADQKARCLHSLCLHGRRRSRCACRENLGFHLPSPLFPQATRRRLAPSHCVLRQSYRGKFISFFYFFVVGSWFL